MTSNDKKKHFTGNKLKAALAMASGEKTQRETATELGIPESTISRWKRDAEYLAYVDDLTLKHENASKAGLLRSVLSGMKIKEDAIDADKSTHLDYVKAAADLQGHNKKQIEHSGELKTTTEAVLFYLPTNGRDVKEIEEDEG